jgi:hypothetical protein
MSYRNHEMADDAAVITPSDATMLDLNGVYIGGAGNLNVETGAGTTVLFTALPVGAQIRNFHIRKILSTSTTATLIVGFKN